MKLPNPLDRVTSIKTKWSIVIVAAVAVTALVSQIGYYLGWPVWIRPIISGLLALAAVQVLARGMTHPLRQMARAAGQMAQGDYHQRVTVTAQDEVGQLATSFNRMAAELAEVDRSQKEFVANASHELRTPVAALRSQLENLVDHVTEPDPETLATMLAQAEHLSKLVVQLLDLSRLEGAGDERSGELVAVGVLLKQVVGEAELLHPASDISLATSGPLGVVADEARLHQLFTNIVGNALRFAPLGSEVAVEAEGRESDVVVRVRDRGPGIAPQDQLRVFERFWQADGSARTGGGGAGLGLAICKRIVDRHGGTIRITSNRPKGTCVTVMLPSRPVT
ncbi:MAG: sensor histidine kinase [Acidimicrobiales bacterium]